MNINHILLDRTNIAINNCKKLEEYHNKLNHTSTKRNPSSEVYKIVDVIK